MRVGIVNLTVCAIGAVARALEEEHGIVLEEMPYIQREPIIMNRLVIDDKSQAVFVKIHDPVLYGTGYFILYIPLANIEKLFLGRNPPVKPEPEELEKACAALSTRVTDGFKKLAVAIGSENLVLSTPRLYAKNTNEELTGVYVDYKYRLSFNFQKNPVVFTDLAYQTKSEKQDAPL